MSGAKGGSAGGLSTGGKGGSSGSSTSTGGGGSSAGNGGGNAGQGGSGTAGGTSVGGSNAAGGESGSGGQVAATLQVTPVPLQTLTVPLGTTSPTVTYNATLGGNPVTVGWNDDNGSIGTVPAGPSNSVVFTPSGSTGGLVDVIAGLDSQTVTRQVFVKLTGSQNGPTNNPSEIMQIANGTFPFTTGGGIGGVGGEGLGPLVGDMPTLAGLAAPSGDGSAQKLKLLYPYDKTVWPRGMLAPLLMWDWTGTATAIRIGLTTTSGSFNWNGTFARPTALPMGQPFVRHPIPQDIWDAATNTAGGATPDGTPDQLIVTLTVADATGAGYGPISETWNVAPGRLTGIIYYNSYGTQLAKNYGGALGGNGQFGGAVLSIHVGDTAPQLVAGSTGGTAECRVCHSVAAGGSRLIVQHGDSYGTSSAYDLTNMGSMEKPLSVGTTFPAVKADGSMALSPNGTLLPLPVDSPPITPTGLSTVATDLGSPTFSPDGAHISFNPNAGALPNTKQKLVVMDFDGTSTFNNPVVVVDDTGQPAATRPGWPAFFPDGSSIVFQHQTVAGGDGNGSGQFYTRLGSKSQIAWTNTKDAMHVTALNALNGLEADGVTPYLPKLATPSAVTCAPAGGWDLGTNDNPDHGDDVNVNYEPTVNPVASGGYVWVVFTSRRMYGNEATIPPFCSDPRGCDLVKNITPKKLWVAAIDLDGTPGTDASHPAFYLPAQELLAGNSRGFWVLDPCKQDGDGCQSGDQCCNGYCEPNGTGGTLVCSNTPPNNQCSGVQEKCSSVADCCDSTNACVNGFCVQAKP